MKLTDDRIERIRSWLDRRGMIDEEISALIDMALAHNAAKRQEPVAWMNKAANVFAQHPEGAKNFGCDTPLFAAPPDLAAKLKEAREFAEKIDLKAEAGLCQMTHGGTRALHEDIRTLCKDFLARTK
jgi:hypothetical protein